MAIIEIDFEVFQKITSMRKNENDSNNDVLRRILKIPATKAPHENTETSTPMGNWGCRGGIIPFGTALRAKYKGKNYTATVGNGGIKMNNKTYSSPSKAAIAITGQNTNGWRFWECKPPGYEKWVSMEILRKER